MKVGAGAGSRAGSVVLPRPGERLLPSLSALLLLLSFPPLHLLVPPLVALIPFGVWVHRLPPGREGARAAARGGALLGFVFFGLLLYWVVVALLAFSWLAVPAHLSVVLILTGVTAVTAWTFHRLHHGARLPLWLALPVAWTAGEWLRAHMGDLSFPWLGLGTSLTGFPELVGIAEVVGARGVTFWLALLNGLGASLVVAATGGRRGIRGGLTLAVVLVALVPASWGVWRAGTLDTEVVARVAVMQPNISQEVKANREIATDSTFRALETLFTDLPPGSVDLVVWPEVTLPEVLNHPSFAGVLERVQDLSRRAGAPLLVGSYGADWTANGDFIIYNSAFLIDRDGFASDAEGRWPPFRYDKHFLVPVVERAPFVNPDWFGGRIFFPGLGRGEGWSLARVEGVGYGVLICYESSFPEASRRFRQEGADILVNITNDGWYGREGPWYGRTTALWQHPAHLVMRAIENRVGVVRAANTGISFFVEPTGRVHDRIGLFEPGTRTAEVRSSPTRTFYTRYGDVVGSASALSVLLLLAFSGVRRRSGPEPAGGTGGL